MHIRETRFNTVTHRHILFCQGSKIQGMCSLLEIRVCFQILLFIAWFSLVNLVNCGLQFEGFKLLVWYVCSTVHRSISTSIHIHNTSHSMSKTQVGIHSV